MKIVLLGGPGAGKSAASKFILKNLPVEYVCTGDIIRNQIQLQSELGKKFQDYVSKGELIPDHLANELFSIAIKHKSSYLPDGYPRSLPQVEYFKEEKPDLLLFLDVSFKIMTERMLGRSRNDDKAEVILTRLSYYRDTTIPAINALKELFPIKTIDASLNIEEVNNKIKEIKEFKNYAFLVPNKEIDGICPKCNGKKLIHKQRTLFNPYLGTVCCTNCDYVDLMFNYMNKNVR